MPLADHVAVRLADEGVPIAVIARAMLRPFDEIRLVLKEAMDAGQLVTLPAGDWKPGAAREPHSGKPALDDHDVNLLRRALKLSGAEARLFAVLLKRDEARKATLHSACQPGGSKTSDPKIVDTYVCKIRRKLAPQGIEIATLWGTGYYLSSANKDKVRVLLAEYGAAVEA